MSGGEGKPWNGPLDTGNNGAKAMIQSGYKLQDGDSLNQLPYQVS